MAKFYFDEHSGLLLRMLRFSDSPIGRNPAQVDYSDYRDQGRLKVPFQRIVSSPRSRYSVRIEQVQDNVPIEDKIFTRPQQRHPRGIRPRVDARSVWSMAEKRRAIKSPYSLKIFSISIHFSPGAA